jgi:glutathione S-transferase
MTEADGYTLYIGNKRYSSWSLRGWLLLEAFGLDFAETLVPLYSAEFEALPARIAPGRQVPTLVHVQGPERRVIWDSLAIAEYLAERHPEAGFWPTDPAARAFARCLAAEMHSGFGSLRGEMPMNLKDRLPGRGRAGNVMGDVARMTDLWRETRSRFGSGGPWLFGAQYTVADAFFTPPATRFRTYGVELDAAASAYSQALLDHPAFRKWETEAAAEPWVEPRYLFNLA